MIWNKYSRREKSVEINGVAYNSDENTDDLVITLKNMGKTRNKSDIIVSHWINYQSQEFEDQS